MTGIPHDSRLKKNCKMGLDSAFRFDVIQKAN